MTPTFLRITDVCAVTGIPRATIYEMVRKGKFPKQVHLSPRTVVWIETEILEWLQARMSERERAAA
jgi:prophage regulatory protein